MMAEIWKREGMADKPLYLRTNFGPVPLKSPYLLERGKKHFTLYPGDTRFSERDLWLAQRFVHWLSLYAYRKALANG